MAFRIPPVLFLSVFILASCSEKTDQQPSTPVQTTKPPNYLFIVIDTLRADHLSAFGYPRYLSPVIDRISRNGTLFMNACCTSPITNPSHASMFTGLYPWQAGSRSNYYLLNPGIDTMAEKFKEKGYQTAAFVSGSPLKAMVSGFDQGFDIYDDEVDQSVFKPGPLMQATGNEPPAGPRKTPGRVTTAYERRDGEKTVTQALEWLQSAREPWFLFVHFYDVHGPYIARYPMAEALKNDEWETADTSLEGVWIPEYQLKQGDNRADYIRRYDSNIYYDDAFVGRLLRFLSSRNILSGTLVHLIADHGESLGENRYGFDHGLNLYQPSLHVPCVMMLPPAVPSGRIDQEIASGIDWPLTVWNLLFQEPFRSQNRFEMPGRVISFSAVKPVSDPWRFCESKPNHPEEPTSRIYGAVNAQQKYIYTSREESQELYDLDIDPGESSSQVYLPEARHVLSTLRLMVERTILHPEVEGFSPGEEITDQEREALKRLGYYE